ncbi:MAG: efflux RND transporter periplasmic adaptor subunit [Planctomycetaceae bacterium]|nr:efflux RND transporter periplasmic adaptor subunit [Planctomycetaceae bacterium]
MMLPRVSFIFSVVVFLVSFGIGCREKPVVEILPPKVIVAQVEQRDVQLYREYTGSTAASEVVTISARVKGFLDQMLFTPGSMVKAGEKLFVIEQAPYRTAIESAEATLMKAQALLSFRESNFHRGEKLVSSRAITEEEFAEFRNEYDQAQGDVLKAKADLEQAKINYSYTEVFAPVTGKISRNLIDVGNLVGGSDQTDVKLATITKMDLIYVYFQIPDSDFQELMLSQQLDDAPMKQPKMRMVSLHTSTEETEQETVSLSIHKPFEMSLLQKMVPNQRIEQENWPYQGMINYDDNIINASTGTITLRGEIVNPDYKIYPGWVCRVRMPFRLVNNALLVHEQAIGIDLNSRYMLIVNDENIVEHRNVEVGEHVGGDMIIVTSGIKPGENYILEGLQKARNGEKVDLLSP